MLPGEHDRPLKSPSNTRAIFPDLVVETASTSSLCEWLSRRLAEVARYVTRPTQRSRQKSFNINSVIFRPVRVDLLGRSGGRWH
jgi:hypothetical protein